uniref:Uncharacterized protein n=1 Tax=Percolomonas cosmopolitus TaxID=63605 RepID=A0A7S1KTF8_9EUKA|mmetsp:Transcript_8352/g.30866  ORF Transcript_8352/g.30866 Transcript_8352/m.30866 type:complete len:516 (+) Transcript_8352:392-1939(+)|eukprot:CAMPEP_0117439378 /NCGR_PEP_ID=MMETSP0759-20121206/2535_1 /TAXON_ID=63605 /ORGANISM="Percolomonas cosmopolitus, Strain WS" /LENGTH=515 /DNA_ID=CAMNT_0005231093 /DNA_START=292 /DNA_END=1839 /DNA_ORIENTATION=-
MSSTDNQPNGHAQQQQEEMQHYLSLTGYDVKEVDRYDNNVQIQTPNFSVTPHDMNVLSETPGGSELFGSGAAAAQTPGFLFASTPNAGTPFLNLGGLGFGLETPKSAGGSDASRTQTGSANKDFPLGSYGTSGGTGYTPTGEFTPSVPLDTPPMIPDDISRLRHPNTVVTSTAATSSTTNRHLPPPSQNNKRKVPPAGTNLPAGKRKKPMTLKLPQKNNAIMAKKVTQHSATTAPPSTTSTTTTKEMEAENESRDTGADDNDPRRAWAIIEKHTPYNLQVHVCSKTRCDPETTIVPKQMFSSLKYQIKVIIKCDDVLRNEFSCLIARCTVVDAEDGYREILKDGSIILDDTPEVALSLTKDGFSGTLKVRFTDCSYHHNSHDFCWVLKFFAPKNLTTPLLVVRSGAYRVLARRPKSVTTKKPKKPNAKKDTTTKSSNKGKNKKEKKRSEADLNPFAAFESKLDELVQSTKYFKEDEKRTAMELVSKKLLEADPQAFVQRITEANNRANNNANQGG